MAEPRITLEQLKTLGVRWVTYVKQLPSPGKHVRIRATDGQYFIVTKTRQTHRGDNVILGDGNESVILRRPSQMWHRGVMGVGRRP